MDKIKTIQYLETSFLSSLLLDEDVTDISFNGTDFYYVSNVLGRRKSSIVVDHQMVKDFVRQIANFTEQQFSYTNPNLDVYVGRYRINATHQSIGKINDEDVITFSIRIASISPRLNDDSDFFNKNIVDLLKLLLANHQSIVIGGVTGTGKTEFQKYLLRNMPKNERVIIIDNVMELDSARSNSDIDLTCWKVDERNPNSNCASLIRNALRNNPDWLILAEARDKEMLDVLNSAMTGSPIITTIHSFDAKSLPYRMARLVLRNEQKMDMTDVLQDIYYHFHYYIYLNKEFDGNEVKRYISEIGFISSKGFYTQIYKKEGGKEKYRYLPKEALSLLKMLDVVRHTSSPFIRGGEEL